jgi:hypothetical protein
MHLCKSRGILELTVYFVFMTKLRASGPVLLKFDGDLRKQTGEGAKRYKTAWMSSVKGGTPKIGNPQSDFCTRASVGSYTNGTSLEKIQKMLKEIMTK